jgi:hypothetical protein
VLESAHREVTPYRDHPWIKFAEDLQRTVTGKILLFRLREQDHDGRLSSPTP